MRVNGVFGDTLRASGMGGTAIAGGGGGEEDDSEVGLGGYCSPRQPMHFEPSSLEFNDMTWRARYARHVIQRPFNPRLFIKWHKMTWRAMSSRPYSEDEDAILGSDAVQYATKSRGLDKALIADPLLFEHDAFTCVPLSGEVMPGGETEITVRFHPHGRGFRSSTSQLNLSRFGH